MYKICIQAGPIEILVEPINTPTAEAILAALPFNSTAKSWGDEVYFAAPVSVEKEADARDIVQPGEIAFWVEGQCIAIGFGPTPISNGNEIRLAASTNIWATSMTDVSILSQVKDGDHISLKAIEE